MSINWHKVASVLVGAAGYAATYIPATVVIPGIGLPLAGVLAGACALTAAVGIVPEQVSPGLASFIKNLAVKKGTKPDA